MRPNLSAMRKVYAIALACCLALGVGGVLFAVVGEWNARRKLPPEMRSPEAIQYHFDGSACSECELGGFMMVFSAIFMGGLLALIWFLLELAERKKARRLP